MNNNIWVFGDLILDINRKVKYTRQSPEDPVCPIGEDERCEYTPGGAANVAAWVKGLCRDYRVSLIGHWPRNSRHGEFYDCYKRSDIGFAWQMERKDGRETVKERIYLGLGDSWKQICRIDQDTDIELSEQESLYTIKELRGRLHYGPPPSAIVIADYGKGVFTGPHLKTFQNEIELFANEYSVPIALNTKYPQNWVNFKADVFVSNESEYGIGFCSFASRYIVTTRGANGVSIINPRGAGVDQNTYADKVRDVTGAGDAFLAGITEFIVSNEETRGFTLTGRVAMLNFLEVGQRAAAYCVEQYGCGKPGKV